MLFAAVLHAGTNSNVRYFSNAGDDAADGNVGFLKVDGKIFARKLFDLPTLQRQWDFIDDGRTVTVWSAKNPSDLSKDIRLAPNMGTIPFVNHMELRGIVVRGTGAHGSNGVGEDIRIVDCGFHEIGGSKLPGYGDGRTRYGNPTIRQHGGKRPDAATAREALIRSRNTFRPYPRTASNAFTRNSGKSSRTPGLSPNLSRSAALEPAN